MKAILKERKKGNLFKEKKKLRCFVDYYKILKIPYHLLVIALCDFQFIYFLNMYASVNNQIRKSK